MTLTVLQEAAAAQVTAALESELFDAWVEVASGSTFWNTEVRKSALGALDRENVNIGKLKGVLLDQVRAGSKTFQSWGELAIHVHEAIAYYAKDTGSWQLSGVLWAAMTETVIEVKLGTVDAVKSVGGGAGIGAIVGFLLVVAIAVKFR